MAVAPNGSVSGTSGSGSAGNKGKGRPEAIRIAERNVALAEENLKQARDEGSETAIDAAKDRLKEAQADLRKINKADPGKDRQQARRDFMEDYFDQLGPEVANLVKTDPELRKLFDEATRKGWDADVFYSELKKTDWWKDPAKGSSWRAAFELEYNQPPGVWKQSLDTAKQAIRDLANELYNTEIPEDLLDKIARRYYYQGWNTNDRGLRVFLANQFDKQSADPNADMTPGGELLNTQRELRDATRNYGLYRPEEWYETTSKSILDPNAKFDAEDAWNELIAEAESLYPVFSGKLSKDRSVRDVGAGYLAQLSRYLEINDPNMIELSDPLLQRAFTNVNEANGDPSLMPLWKFTQEIKKDARWQYTTNALDTYSSIGSDMARMMGFVR